MHGPLYVKYMKLGSTTSSIRKLKMLKINDYKMIGVRLQLC